MTLSELRQKPHLSCASINDYTDCGLLYKLSRIDKTKQEFKSDSLEFGSVIHMTLGEFYQQKMAGNIMSLEEMLTTFERYWTVMGTDRVDIQYSEGKSFEKLLDDGRKLLTVYYENRPKDNFQTIALEEPFEFYVDGCEVPIIGAMDLVEEDSSGTIIITDFKTAGRTYS